MNPFKDLNVLSLEQATVLPYLTYCLAQDGMNVIQLEHPVGGDQVQREASEPAATLLRLAPSHLRFGSFEVLAARGREDLVKALADHAIANHFPSLTGRYAAWLREVSVRTARLVASWQAVGFAHGVMNTVTTCRCSG